MRFMTEFSELEITPQLPVDAREQVQVEVGRHPLRVVVSGVEDFDVLLQVDPDHHRAA